jgi:hypothetical protein
MGYFDWTNTSELWVQMGNVSSVKDGRRFLPIHELCSSLSEITCRVFPAAHALSGCDTTSSFFGIGKKSVYKILKDATDRKYAKLWSGMRHEEYADEAPLLKVII